MIYMFLSNNSLPGGGGGGGYINLSNLPSHWGYNWLLDIGSHIWLLVIGPWEY